MRKVASFLIAAVMGAGLAGAGPEAAAAPGASASSCPELVVLAARGSDQNTDQGEYHGPTSYGGRASAGWEGPNFTAFFNYVEARHPGTMSRVQVLGLDEDAYPAAMGLPALAQEGQTLTPWGVIARLAEIAPQIPGLLAQTPQAVVGSVRTGIDRAPGVLRAWEEGTGCRPDVVVAGYSQGAIVGTAIERELAATGRLRGAMYFGNPLRAGTGMAAWLPQAAGIQPAADIARIDYCLSGDFACDLTVGSAVEALQTKARRHASYFLDAAQGRPTAGDSTPADTFAAWVGTSRW